MKKLILLSLLFVAPAFAEESNKQDNNIKDFSPEYVSQIQAEKKREYENEKTSEEKWREHQEYLKEIARMDHFGRD